MTAFSSVHLAFRSALSGGIAYALRDDVLIHSRRGRRLISLYYLLRRHGASDLGDVMVYAQALPPILRAARILCQGRDDDVVVDSAALQALQMVVGLQHKCEPWWLHEVELAWADAQFLAHRNRIEVLRFLDED